MGNGLIPETYEKAMLIDSNVIHMKQYEAATNKQLRQLVDDKETIIALARHHIGVDSDSLITVNWKGCKIGSFNICFPLVVERPDAPPINLFFRCAMPHKLGELRSAGAIDEKMRCEVATYAWMQEKCPDIRIPYLYGFGLYDGAQFTHQSQRPFLTRVVQYFRRLLHTWMWPSTILSHYVSHPSQHRFSTAYMVLEDVSTDGSRTLYETWEKYGDDVRRRQNFFGDYAKTIISLARVPQPRIGSFRFHADGTITLSNRPLTTALAILENDGSPPCISRDRTYTSTESYVSDMLSFHAGRLSTHPNVAMDGDDLRTEMAGQVGFRSVARDFFHPDRREGPFVLQLDDFHISNIFVDDNWHIRSLVDLEWVNALPVENMAAPYWLVKGDIASFSGEQLDLFKKKRLEYMEIFQAEERKAAPAQETFLTNAINWAWERQGSWFWMGIHSTNALPCMFQDHISRWYGYPYTQSMLDTLSQLWCYDSKAFVERREKDFAAYRLELKGIYDKERENGEEASTDKPNGKEMKVEGPGKVDASIQKANNQEVDNGNSNTGGAINEMA
ncbi:hypothetical protein E4U21_005579 [Claviceps maximensis]|nr:hypothetical protein E4U21_005579 [Claviceps maximensis]